MSKRTIWWMLVSFFVLFFSNVFSLYGWHAEKTTHAADLREKDAVIQRLSEYAARGKAAVLEDSRLKAGSN